MSRLQTTITHDFTFEAAHQLPNVPAGHKCGRMHGHNYQIEVRLTGPVDSTSGWVMDFADVAAVCTPWLAQLDHRVLNDIAGLENPTSERLAAWLWAKLEPSLPGLETIVVHENRDMRCCVRRQA